MMDRITGVTNVPQGGLAHCSYCHGNAKGTGKAMRLALRPASGDGAGFIEVEIAPQDADIGGQRVFDWDRAVRFRLGMAEISQVMMVFRGYRESICDGRGIFRRDGVRDTTLRLSHVVEPVPGYSISVLQKVRSGAPIETTQFLLTLDEAFGLCMAIEGVMAYVAFGLPVARSLGALQENGEVR